MGNTYQTVLGDANGIEQHLLSKAPKASAPKKEYSSTSRSWVSDEVHSQIDETLNSKSESEYDEKGNKIKDLRAR